MILSSGDQSTLRGIDVLQPGEELVQGLASALFDYRLVQASTVGCFYLLEVLDISRIFGLGLLQNMSKGSFSIFLHDCPSENGTLVGTHVMTLSPSAADILVEVSAGVDLTIFRVEVV